jgi:NhaP-type Na+/H+ or K+/H+ antiporter
LINGKQNGNGEDGMISTKIGDLMAMFFGFVSLAAISMLLGVFFGLLTSLVLKYIPKLSRQPVKECTILLVMAYISYLVAEHIEFSGITTLFCCGFTMSHYAFHNISAECQIGSTIAAETTASVAESFLYVYLGLSALTIES